MTGSSTHARNTASHDRAATPDRRDGDGGLGDGLRRDSGLGRRRVARAALRPRGCRRVVASDAIEGDAGLRGAVVEGDGVLATAGQPTEIRLGGA